MKHALRIIAEAILSIILIFFTYQFAMGALEYKVKDPLIAGLYFIGAILFIIRPIYLLTVLIRKLAAK